MNSARSRRSSGVAKKKKVVRRFELESLEPRLLLYSPSGYSWASPNVSASYVPDGTPADPGYNSTLFLKMNSVAPTATWQREFARALQTWANSSNLNFRIVSDNGAAAGTSGSIQGDSRFGDVRLFANPLGTPLAAAYYPCCDTNGGDVYLNPDYTYQLGGTYDFYSVMLHEIGHSIGLRHSDPGTVMYGTYSGIKTGLSADDIAGVQSIYGARRQDNYDAAAANDSFASASSVSLTSAGVATIRADLTTLADVDYYSVIVPAGGDGTLAVSVDSRGISLAAPKLTVYDSSQNLVSTASADYGGVASLNFTGLAAGSRYFLVADGASPDVFGVGAYTLQITFGGISGGSGDGGGGGGGGGGGLSPDRFEVNDTPQIATNLGKSGGVSLTSLTVDTATDLDYFSFIPSRSATYQVSALFTGSAGNLDLKVYDSSLRLLASGNATTSNETVSLNLTSGQRYFVEVLGAAGATNSYDLDIGKASKGGKPGIRPPGDDGDGPGRDSYSVTPVRHADGVERTDSIARNGRLTTASGQAQGVVMPESGSRPVAKASADARSVATVDNVLSVMVRPSKQFGSLRREWLDDLIMRGL